MTWQVAVRSVAGGVASISVPTSPDLGYQIRLRALYCTLAGVSAGGSAIVVRDGATGVGTILYESTLETLAGNRDVVNITKIDLRATVGNVLTVEFLAGVAGDFEAVNALGDYIPPGIPSGATALSV